MKHLDDIRARVECFGGHGSPGYKAPEDRAKLLAALDAVQELTSDLAKSGDPCALNINDMVRKTIDEALL